MVTKKQAKLGRPRGPEKVYVGTKLRPDAVKLLESLRAHLEQKYQVPVNRNAVIEKAITLLAEAEKVPAPAA